MYLLSNKAAIATIKSTLQKGGPVTLSILRRCEKDDDTSSDSSSSSSSISSVANQQQTNTAPHMYTTANMPHMSFSSSFSHPASTNAGVTSQTSDQHTGQVSDHMRRVPLERRPSWKKTAKKFNEEEYRMQVRNRMGMDMSLIAACDAQCVVLYM